MEDEDLARAIAASLEDQKNSNPGEPVPKEEGEKSGGGHDQKAETTPEGDPKEPKKEETEEEIQARIKGKLEAMKKKKAEEEKEMERLREIERVRTGKEMLQQKRLLEDQERQRLADFRKREKEEKRRAKQAVMEQIARDKAERRSGIPPGSSQEQKDSSTCASDDKRQRGPFGVKPISTQTKVRDLLVKIRKTYSKERADTAFKTLNAYVGNLLRQPLEAKFRSIKASNNAFQQRIASLEGGEATEILSLLGFTLQGDFYQLEEDKFNKLAVEGACGELENALHNPFFGVL